MEQFQRAKESWLQPSEVSFLKGGFSSVFMSCGFKKSELDSLRFEDFKLSSDPLFLHNSLEIKEYISNFSCDCKEKNGKTSPTKSDSSFKSEETISSTKKKDDENILNVAEVFLKNKSGQNGISFRDLNPSTFFIKK